MKSPPPHTLLIFCRKFLNYTLHKIMVHYHHPSTTHNFSFLFFPPQGVNRMSTSLLSAPNFSKFKDVLIHKSRRHISHHPDHFSRMRNLCDYPPHTYSELDETSSPKTSAPFIYLSITFFIYSYWII